MLSHVEPRVTSFSIGKREEKTGSISPKFASGSSVADEPTNASSPTKLKVNPEQIAACITTSTATPIPIPTSTFSHFSAANLFGLFDNEFKYQIKTDETPMQNERRGNGNENNGNFPYPVVFGGNSGSGNSPIAAPIDQLLQISQQILSDSVTKQHQKQLNQHGGSMNATGGGRRGTRGGGGGGDNGVAGGKQQSEMSERKRSYPYTFQFCVLCQKNVHSSKLPCHIRQCHVGKPMFQCPVCDFTSTYSKNNVKSHMVSLHGLAGDPISYMDQYAAQVEDFMKKCFPNVRGRGRPIHGRFSPSVKLGMSPTSTVASSGTESGSTGPLELTAPSITLASQQRRHSSVALPSTAANTQHQYSQQRGRQKGSQRAVVVGNGNSNNNNSMGETVVANGNAPTGCGISAADFYGGIPEAGSVSQKGQNEQHNHHLNMFDKLAFPTNSFTSVPAFNPFLYLQQLNGFLPTPFNANGVETKNVLPNGNENCDHLSSKIENMDTAGSGILPESTGTLLEECLNFSQKFLREINEKNGQGEGYCDRGEANKMMTTTCHSSSSATSPPSPSLLANRIDSISDFHDDKPRYLPHSIDWTVLDGPGLEKTVYSTFSNSNELIEKFDLTIFESHLEQNSAGSLLTLAQKEKIAKVRSQLNLQSFEILFALHRLDQTILKPEQIHLVEQIAPTKTDIRRFALLEQSNSMGSLDKDEQFIIELSKVDRLKERLAVMALMGELDERVAKISQQLQHLSSAAKLLYNSAQFHTLLHLLLTSINMISGDFTVQLVKGFHPSRILQICAFRFPNGATLLEEVAQIVKKHFPDLLQFISQSKNTIEKAAKVEFSRILNELRSLEKGQAQVEEEELHLSGGVDGKNHQFANFHTHCALECAQLKEVVQNTKSQLASTMDFFGDIRNEFGEFGESQFRPETFFSVIAQFFDDLLSVANAL